MSMRQEFVPVEEAALASGIPLLVATGPSAAVTTVTLWVRSGSRDEQPATTGMTHVLEHLLMEQPLPGGDLSCMELVQGVGGEANALTSREFLMLLAAAPTRYGVDVARWLAQALAGQHLSEQVLAAQKRVVVEELRAAADDPMDLIHDVFFRTVFEGMPLGRPVGGTPETVTTLTADAARRHWRERVHAGTVGVVAAGGLTVDELRRALDDSPLGALPHGAWLAPARLDGQVPPPPATGRRSVSTSSSYAAVAVGGRGAAAPDPDRVAYEVLPMLMAGTGTSLLFREIRSRRGLSYDVWGRYDAYRDVGAWRVAIGTSPENLEEVLGTARELLAGRAAAGWSPEEVSTAKRQAAGLIELEAETSAGVATLLGRHRWLARDPDWSPRRHIDAIESLRHEEVEGAYREAVEPLVTATVAAGGEGEGAGDRP